jgi:PAS domain S-box-containing protein
VKFNDLVIFLAYNKTALAWAEAHPELAYEGDQRAIENLGPLLNADPRLADFFANYKGRMNVQADRRTQWLTEENKKLIAEEQAARQLADVQNTKLQSVLDCTAEGIWGLGLDGKITFANQETVKIFGYENESQIVGQNSHFLFHHSHEDGSTYPREKCPIFKAMPLGLDVHLENDIFWKADGTSFHGEYRSKPLYIAGQLQGAVVTFFDVSDRVAAEKKIKESEVQFSVLANSIPQLAWMAHADGYIYWYNQNWYGYTGTTPAQMEGWGWQSVHDPKILPFVMEHWPSSIATGKPFKMEFPLKNASGEYRTFLTQASPVKDGDGIITGWIGSNTDIQEQKDSIQQLETERDSREHFVNALTHDLRTPLTAAKLTGQMIKRKVDDKNAVLKMADRVIASMNRANGMIRDLLDANRIKAGENIPLSIEACSLDQIVEDTLADLNTIYGPRFKTEIEPDAKLLQGYWDPSAIQRILENLSGNAVKYGHAETPVSIGVKASKDWIELAVHNEGSLISPEDQESLFSPYKRTASAQTGGQIGWGIGLALVKGITEAQGGSVSVSSEVSKGTTFVVRLPRDARIQ